MLRPVSVFVVFLGLAAAQVSIPITRRAPYQSPFHVKGQSISLRGDYTNVGEYIATIQVGGQDIVVSIDTGSSTLAVPDATCDGTCPTGSGSYDSSRSSFHESIRCGNMECSSSFCSRDPRYRDQCSFRISYADGSGLRGVSAKDRISLGGYSGTAMFGRVLHEVGTFTGPGQAPGILGVAYNALNCAPCPVYGTYCNSPCFDTVLERLHAESGLPLKFGMCLTAEGGVWDLGFIDSQKALTPVQYVPVVPGRSGAYDYYTVNLIGTRSATFEVPLVGGYQTVKPIIDSGTTLIIAPSNWVSSLKHVWASANLPLVNELFDFDRYGAPPTVAMTAAQASQYPDITFEFDNSVTVTLKWHHYLLDLRNNGQTRTLGLASDTNNLFILGDIFMQAAYVVFDQESNRVGFAPLKPGSCVSTSSSNTPPPSGSGAHNGRLLVSDAGASNDSYWSSSIVGGIAGFVATLTVVAVLSVATRRRSVSDTETSKDACAHVESKDLEAHHDACDVADSSSQSTPSVANSDSELKSVTSN